MTIRNFRPKDDDILSQPVIKLPNTREVLDWNTLTRGSICFGNSGSGKTSGFGQHTLRSILESKARPGGLILCVKQDDRIRYERLIQETGNFS